MYTIQFGNRSGFIDAANADAVFRAMHERERFVTVQVDIANDGGASYEVTLNVDQVIAVIKHRAEKPEEQLEESEFGRPRLSVVT